MCGLVGAVDFANDGHRHGLRLTPFYVEALIEKNIHRGGSQYGIATQSVHDNPMSALKLNGEPNAATVAGLLTNDEYTAFMFHTRAATTSNLNKTLDHVQPFYTDEPYDAIPYAFMQNAILHGWEADAARLGVETDSQVICKAFEKFYATPRLEDALCNVASKYGGQQASALYLPGSRMLYLWRVMNPLYINWVDPGTLIFASTPLKTGSWELIPEGQIVKIQPSTKVLSYFKYNSIYGNTTA